MDEIFIEDRKHFRELISGKKVYVPVFVEGITVDVAVNRQDAFSVYDSIVEQGMEPYVMSGYGGWLLGWYA